MIDYIPNVEAEEIAAEIIAKFHPNLTGIKIAHLLKVRPVPKKRSTKQPRQGRKVVMAKASKVSAKMQALASQDYKFVIEYDSMIWDELNSDTRTALVDHELCHCGNDADGCYMKNHSVEEFREILSRYGFWKDDVLQFAETTEEVYHGTMEATNGGQ